MHLCAICTSNFTYIEILFRCAPTDLIGHWEVSSGVNNALVPITQQAITWTNNDHDRKHRMPLLDQN